MLIVLSSYSCVHVVNHQMTDSIEPLDSTQHAFAVSCTEDSLEYMKCTDTKEYVYLYRVLDTAPT